MCTPVIPSPNASAVEWYERSATQQIFIAEFINNNQLELVTLERIMEEDEEPGEETSSGITGEKETALGITLMIPPHHVGVWASSPRDQR